MENNTARAHWKMQNILVDEVAMMEKQEQEGPSLMMRKEYEHVPFHVRMTNTYLNNQNDVTSEDAMDCL